jgi:Ankyrin repeat
MIIFLNVWFIIRSITSGAHMNFATKTTLLSLLLAFATPLIPMEQGSDDDRDKVKNGTKEENEFSELIVNPLTKEEKEKIFSQTKKAIEEERNLSSQQNTVIPIDDNLFDVTECYRLNNVIEQPHFNEYYLPKIREFLRDHHISATTLMQVVSALLKSSSNTLKREMLIRELLTHPNLNITDDSDVAAHPLVFSDGSLSLCSLFVPQFFGSCLTRTTNDTILQQQLESWSFREYTSGMNLLSQILMITRYERLEIFINQALYDLPEYFQHYIKKCSIETGNEAAPDGTTALMFAVGGGFYTLVEELLCRGANPLVQNIYGDNALTVLTVQLQRHSLTKEQRAIFKKIEKLLKETLTRRAQLVRSQIDILMEYGLPYELALKIALGACNHQESILAYLEHNSTLADDSTLTERLVVYLHPYGLGTLLFLSRSFSFINK